MSVIDDFTPVYAELEKVLAQYAKLERDNATLKKAVRIIAYSMALDEDGNTRLKLSREDAEYLKMAVDTCKIMS